MVSNVLVYVHASYQFITSLFQKHFSLTCENELEAINSFFFFPFWCIITFYLQRALKGAFRNQGFLFLDLVGGILVSYVRHGQLSLLPLVLLPSLPS